VQNKKVAVAIGAAVALVTVSACSGSETDTSSSGSPAATSVATSTSAAPTDAQAHNDADVAFASGMIPHHQQAVEMSDIVLAKEGIDPQVVALAEQIKAAQAPEIETMQGWLNDWKVAPAPPMTSGMPGHENMPPGHQMPGHEMPGHQMPGHQMPGHEMQGHEMQGMLSPADIAMLQNAQGVEASRLFLTQMIEHHEGAITMAQTEIDDGQYVPAIDMSRTIVSSQQAEIDSMKKLLQSL
jgi:uncharacterized protein (DUF305 family)